MNRDSLYEYEPYHPYLNLSKYDLSADGIKNILFMQIVREMMYGFGDNVQTLPQTVNLMEAIAKDYLQTIVLIKSIIFHRLIKHLINLKYVEVN